MPSLSELMRRAFGRSAGVLGAVLLLSGSIGAGEAAEVDAASATRAGIVALSVDAGSAALLMASADALHRSDDGGRSWRRLPLPSPTGEADITALATPAGGGAILVAGPRLGVARSENGGETWTTLGEGLPGRDVVALAAHWTEPATYYAYLPPRAGSSEPATPE